MPIFRNSNSGPYQLIDCNFIRRFSEDTTDLRQVLGRLSVSEVVIWYQSGVFLGAFSAHNGLFLVCKHIYGSTPKYNIIVSSEIIPLKMTQEKDSLTSYFIRQISDVVNNTISGKSDRIMRYARYPLDPALMIVKNCDCSVVTTLCK